MSEIEELREIKEQEIREINIAYRAARRAGEILLGLGKITFDEYKVWMLGFESALRDHGVDF
jgi:hypothetical protein